MKHNSISLEQENYLIIDKVKSSESKFKVREYQADKIKKKLDKDIRLIKGQAKQRLIGFQRKTSKELNALIDYSTISIDNELNKIRQKPNKTKKLELVFNNIKTDFSTNAKFKFKNNHEHCSHELNSALKFKLKSLPNINTAKLIFPPDDEPDLYSTESLIFRTDNRNQSRRKNIRTLNPLTFIKTGKTNTFSQEERASFWESLFKFNSTAVKNYLESKFSLDEFLYFNKTAENIKLIEDHIITLSKNKPKYEFSSVNSRICLILKELIEKRDPPYLSYKNMDKLHVQIRLLMLLSESLVKKVKNIDLIFFHNKVHPKKEYDFKIFSSTYGQTVKKVSLFNKKHFISKNLQQTSVIWPFIKKEDVSKILNLEGIYDAIFNHQS